VTVPQDPTVQGGPHVKVLKIGTCLPGYYGADKIYLTPFAENVSLAMQKAQRPSDPKSRGHISLVLSKDGAPNPTTAPDLDSFVNADFETLWTERTTPQPQIRIDSKDLLNYTKHDRESREQAHQYT
jgi:hypothetical protein